MKHSRRAPFLRRMRKGSGGLCRHNFPGHIICTRWAGHLGNCVRGTRAAWYADRYAATNGYRRKRRKQGARWESRPMTARRFKAYLAANAAALSAFHGPQGRAGPWQGEPDREVFVAHGFVCEVLRHPYFGSLCGYVGVEKAHPYFGKHYDDVDVEVHGGLTFGRKRRRVTGTDLWWLGFDCGHAWDLQPWMLTDPRRAPLLIDDCEYRTFDYVRDQVVKLAEQLRDKRGN